MQNIYKPTLATIKEIIQETPDIKTFNLEIENSFDYKPGQFVELSVFGEGEAPFCISNSPTRKTSIECSIKCMGRVTQGLYELDIGDTVGIRGPYGNGFPVDYLSGKNLLFIAGGIGLAPLRSLFNYVLDYRDKYKKIIFLNGARTSKDLVYKNEYNDWKKAKDLEFHLTIDKPEEGWNLNVGVVPKILKEVVKPKPQDAVSVICGPPIMIKYTIHALLELGFKPEDIITTLEMKMKCGLGMCGRCNIGPKYICKDGPVFSYKQLEELGYEF